MIAALRPLRVHRPLRAGLRLLGALGLLALACASPAPIAPDVRAEERIRDGRDRLVFDGPAAARVAFEDALRWSPGDPRALHGLWEVALAEGDLDRAMGLLEQLEAEQPAYLGEHARRERCATLGRAVGYYLERDRSREALAAAARLERSDCGHPEASALRASALIAEATRVRSGPNALRAVSFYQEAVEADPSRVDAYRGAGEALLGVGRRDEALALLSDALAHHPDDTALQELMLRALSTP